MLHSFYEVLGRSSPAALVIISIALMLACGFAMTRITKLLHLPNVTAYIITGVLMGPYCLNLIPHQVIAGTDFLADIALAFIAFSVGEYFRLSALRKNGPKVILIMLIEATVCTVLVFVLTYYILGLHMAYAIVLAALASATAPTSMIVIIRQTHAKGDFVDTLLQVVALDDMVSLVAYSVAISVALGSISGSLEQISFQLVGVPILTNIGVLLLGGLFGILLKLLMPRGRSKDNRLIISIAVLFAFCGVCAVLDISPLLGCMSMGTVYINVSEDEKLFKQLNYFSPPILLLFFVRSGLNFNLDALLSADSAVGSIPLLVIGVSYCVVRIIGKCLGAFLGGLAVGKPPKVRNYMGMALITQAGVAIGLATLCARTLGDPIGTNLQTIIMASSIIYEIIGPASVKLALYLSGSYSNKLEDMTHVAEQTHTGQPRRPVDVLIARIHEIQESLPDLSSTYVPEEEEAFLEAEEEQYESPVHTWRQRFWNRK